MTWAVKVVHGHGLWHHIEEALVGRLSLKCCKQSFYVSQIGVRQMRHNGSEYKQVSIPYWLYDKTLPVVSAFPFVMYSGLEVEIANEAFDRPWGWCEILTLPGISFLGTTEFLGHSYSFAEPALREIPRLLARKILPESPSASSAA